MDELIFNNLILSIRLKKLSFILSEVKMFNRREKYNKRILSVFLVLIFAMANRLDSSDKNSKLLEYILLNLPSKFEKIVKNPENFRLQILYTQVDRDENNKPNFSTYSFRNTPNEYFYPASTIKLPTAVLALEKARKNKNIAANTQFIISNQKEELKKIYTKNSDLEDKYRISELIHKIFVVSDNDAYNYLFEYLGRDYINKRLWSLGYKNAIIRHRLQHTLSDDLNAYTNPIYFYKNGKVIENQKTTISDLNFEIPFKNYQIGNSRFENGVIKNEPMDFSTKNFMSLQDQHQFLIRLMFPENFKDNDSLILTEEDYHLLYREMSVLPKESQNPKYLDYKSFYDGFTKFFIYGDTEDKIPENIKIFSKSGLAFGFALDNAYIIDTSENIEFFLSAVIYTNENKVINDDQYEYESLGIPFLANLGKRVFEIELDRERDFLPDFDGLFGN